MTIAVRLRDQLQVTSFDFTCIRGFRRRGDLERLAERAAAAILAKLTTP